MPEGRRNARWLKTAQLLALTILPSLLVLVVAETVATVAIARRARVIRDSSGRSLYTMRVGKWPWSRPTVTPLNSLGYPDEEWPTQRESSECTRVLFAGDSYVFGDGVDRDSSFVEIVRRRAAAAPDGRCVRMFNIAVRGTTIDRQSKAIKAALDALQPDLVILGQYQNDLTDLNSPGAILDPNRERNADRPVGDSIRVRLRIFEANVIKMLTYHAFGFMIRNDMRWDILRHWSVMADSSRAGEARRFQLTYDSIYANLVAELRHRGVAFGVIILPSKLDLLAKRFPEESYFVELARRHQVPHLRLFPALDSRRSTYAFLMYDGHLNEHGNRVVADELYRWMFPTSSTRFWSDSVRTPAPSQPLGGRGGRDE